MSAGFLRDVGYVSLLLQHFIHNNCNPAPDMLRADAALTMQKTAHAFA